MLEDTLNLTLLFDYYGDLLSQKQQICFDLYYNQDFSLGEIAEQAGISRQGVHDCLGRAETVLRNMEAKTGFIAQEQRMRAALSDIRDAARRLQENPSDEVRQQAAAILAAADSVEE